MIKKILIILSFFFLNNVAIADQKIPNWVFVGKNISESSVYVDINNINSKSKNIKQYWTKLNSTKPMFVIYLNRSYDPAYKALPHF